MTQPELLPPFRLDSEATGPQITQLAKAIQTYGPTLGVTLVKLITDSRRYQTLRGKSGFEGSREARIFISDASQQHLLATHHDLKNNLHIAGYKGALELTIDASDAAERTLRVPFAPPASEQDSMRQGLRNLGRNMLDAFVDQPSDAVEEFIGNLRQHLQTNITGLPLQLTGYRADPAADEFHEILSRIPSRPVAAVGKDEPRAACG